MFYDNPAQSSVKNTFFQHGESNPSTEGNCDKKWSTIRRGVTVRVFIGMIVCLNFTTLAQAEFLDRLALLQLLRNNEFSTLEKKLTAQERLYKEGKIPEEHVESAYFSFANSDPSIEENLNEWIEHERIPGLARLARGVYYWNLGWLTRGSQYSSKTPEERFTSMRNFFALAWKDLWIGIHQKPDSAIPYRFILSITMTLGDREGLNDYLHEGLQADPRSFIVRWQYLYSLTPWWSGMSKNESLRVIREFLKDHVRPWIANTSKLKVLEGFPDFVSAEMLQRKNFDDESITFYEQALQHGEDYYYRYRLGTTLYHLSRYEEAQRVLAKSLKDRPQVADVHEYRGWALSNLGKTDEAVAEFERGLQLDTHSPELLRGLADALVDKKQYQEAVAALTKALVYGAHDEYVVKDLGRVYFYDLNNPAKSLEYFKHAIELNPTRSIHWYNYGAALYKMKDCRAIPALQQYRNRCEAGTSCDEESLEWANKAIPFMVKKQGCSSSEKPNLNKNITNLLWKVFWSIFSLFPNQSLPGEPTSSFPENITFSHAQ